jgi:hypothetical protein
LNRNLRSASIVGTPTWRGLILKKLGSDPFDKRCSGDFGINKTGLTPIIFSVHSNRPWEARCIFAVRLKNWGQTRFIDGVPRFFDRLNGSDPDCFTCLE